MGASNLRQGQFLVAVSAETAYVKVEGLATMNNCPPLQEFLEDLRGRGLHDYVFDFSACRGFDSTFMGTLVSLVMPRGGEGGRAGSEPRNRVILLNLTDEHRGVLGSVGVDRIVDVCSGQVPLPQVRLKRLEKRKTGAEAQLRNLVSVHERLIQLDPRNEEKFGAFVRLVKRELDRR
jgi:hypothetical protein